MGTFVQICGDGVRRDGAGEEGGWAGLGLQSCCRRPWAVALQANLTPLNVKTLPKRLLKLHSKAKLKIGIQANRDDQYPTRVLKKETRNAWKDRKSTSATFA